MRATGPVSRNLLARTLTAPTPVGYEGVRRHGNKRSGKGGSSTGGVQGQWRTVSPSYKTTATIDAAYSQTISRPNR